MCIYQTSKSEREKTTLKEELDGESLLCWLPMLNKYCENIIKTNMNSKWVFRLCEFEFLSHICELQPHRLYWNWNWAEAWLSYSFGKYKHLNPSICPNMTSTVFGVNIFYFNCGYRSLKLTDEVEKSQEINVECSRVHVSFVCRSLM